MGHSQGDESNPKDFQPQSQSQGTSEDELHKAKRYCVTLYHENSDLKQEIKKLKKANSKREESLLIKNSILRRRLVAQLDLCASNYRLRKKNIRLQKRVRFLESKEASENTKISPNNCTGNDNMIAPD